MKSLHQSPINLPNESPEERIFRNASTHSLNVRFAKAEDFSLGIKDLRVQFVYYKYKKEEEHTVFAIQSITKSEGHYQRWYDHQQFHRDNRYKSILVTKGEMCVGFGSIQW